MTKQETTNITAPTFEVADVFRLYGDEFRRSHPLSLKQHQVMRAIEQCRTAALGGHVDECDQCGILRISYNSCRDRHCPKCGALAKAAWLRERRAELLPIDYFHVIFTIDHLFNPLARSNPRPIYDLLFKAATHTLKAFGRQYLGGEIGIMAVLHTWGQNLGQHIHLHCIVTGGALAPDGNRWQASPSDFLFPAIPLSAAFRDRFCEGLLKLHRTDKLIFAGACSQLAVPATFASLVQQAQNKSWQVYIKEPFGGAEKVLDYLGRYVNRIAISNHRIIEINNGQVHFKWRDYRDENQCKVMVLPASEFIRRFLLHVLPKRFVRIRYYGLWHPARRAKLQRCRALLGLNPELPQVDKLCFEELLQQLTGIDLFLCPFCHQGRMVRQQSFEPLIPIHRLKRQAQVLSDIQLAA